MQGKTKLHSNSKTNELGEEEVVKYINSVTMQVRDTEPEPQEEEQKEDDLPAGWLVIK